MVLLPGAILARKISGSHGPADKGEKGGLGEAPANFLPRPFCPKKTPYFSTEIGHLYTKSCKNERAKVKESRQNDREIRSTER